jgi:RND family efflux transporter MFP subunit
MPISYSPGCVRPFDNPETVVTTSVRRSSFALLLAFAVGAAACGRSTETAQAVAADPLGSPNRPIEVALAPVVERELQVSVSATGSFTADEVSDVASEASGQVAATPVDIGDRVEKGAVIARLNTADAQLRLDQARAGLQQAEASLAQAQGRYTLARANAARYDALLKTGDVSRTVADQNATESETLRHGVVTAEAAVADARSRLALAQKALSDTVIRAPFTGFITDRPIAVGEYVTPSSKIATVMKLDPIRLRLQVPELEAARLRVGQDVAVNVEALGARGFSGRITAINPALDPSTRATIVEATLANREGVVRAGMFATARVALGETERGLFVPKAAVVADPNTNSFRVFTVAGDTARLRVVQPGGEQAGSIRIVSGLEPGAHVATAGFEHLFDGATVRTAERTARK